MDFSEQVAGAVKALADFGFDSVKLDSGFSIGHNLTLWAELLNKTGKLKANGTLLSLCMP